MRGSGEAVDASVLAAPVGIHTRREAYVWAVVSAHDGSRGIAEEASSIERRLFIWVRLSKLPDFEA